MSLQSLTIASTTCIVLSGASLLLGWYFIRWRKDIIKHRNTMLSATALAAGFLIFYVTRWAVYGTKLYAGTGGWRILYFANLVPHILLAMVLPVLVARLLQLALVKRDYLSHRKLARVVMPIWLYVAASGWLIYYLLYVKTY